MAIHNGIRTVSLEDWAYAQSELESLMPYSRDIRLLCIALDACNQEETIDTLLAVLDLNRTRTGEEERTLYDLTISTTHSYTIELEKPEREQIYLSDKHDPTYHYTRYDSTTIDLYHAVESFIFYRGYNMEPDNFRRKPEPIHEYWL